MHVSEKDTRTIRAQQHMSSILSPTPANLVDFFLNFERFEIVEFRLVRLKLGMEAIFTPLFAATIRRIRSLKHHNTATLITRGEVVTRRIEFDC